MADSDPVVDGANQAPPPEPKHKYIPKGKRKPLAVPTQGDEAPIAETVPDIPRTNRAAEMLKSKTLRDAKKRAEAEERDNEAMAYFLICPRVGWNAETKTGHVAAWLTEKPQGGRIHPGMWESLHHRAGDPWTHQYIPCQECYVEGESRPWNVHVRPAPRGDGSYDFVLAAERKYVIGSIPRAELEARRESLEESVAPVAEEAS